MIWWNSVPNLMVRPMIWSEICTWHFLNLFGGCVVGERKTTTSPDFVICIQICRSPIPRNHYGSMFHGSAFWIKHKLVQLDLALINYTHSVTYHFSWIIRGNLYIYTDGEIINRTRLLSNWFRESRGDRFYIVYPSLQLHINVGNTIQTIHDYTHTG